MPFPAPAAQRFERHERGHRLEPHGFLHTGVEVVERIHLMNGKRGGIEDDAPHFVLRAPHRFRVALQQVQHPGQRIGRGVFAGQQHGRHIAGHGAVIDAAAALVGDAAQDLGRLTRRVSGNQRVFHQRVLSIGRRHLDQHLNNCIGVFVQTTQ